MNAGILLETVCRGLSFCGDSPKITFLAISCPYFICYLKPVSRTQGIWRTCKKRGFYNLFFPTKVLLSQSRCFAINWHIILYYLENLILIKNKSFQNNFCTVAYSQPRIWVSTHFHKSRGGSLRAANAGSTATSSHGPARPTMHPIRRFGDDTSTAVAARADALKHVLQL